MRLSSASHSSGLRWQVVVAALWLSAAGIACAQTDASGDPPSRVARLSVADGDLGLMPAGASTWSDAGINRPLTNGDKLSSGPDARAELELGGGVMRIAAQTDIGFLTLNDQIAQIELTQGTLNLNAQNFAAGETYEIDTPTLALVVNQPGIFRVDVGSDGGSTSVTTFAGSATAYGENSAQQMLYAGRTYTFNDSSLSNAMVSNIQGGDAFDAWCSDRDNRYASADNNEAPQGSSQYVSDDVVGAQDLDTYGAWQSDPDYGAIWFPGNVDAGWAPYRFGHWAWIGPWGWTWIDNLPWGFAPYHYGRWAYVHNHWGWLPGPRGGRAVYAPALVAFVGGGVGAGGPVGWFPLGPGEIYNPWYRASHGYYTSVNVSNINAGFGRGALINNINHQYGFYASGRIAPNATYANRNAPHAFSAVSAQNFASARNVQASMLRTTPQQMANAPVLAGSVVQRPTAASFGPARAINARALPAAGFSRPVVAYSAPASALPANTVTRGGQAPASNVRVLSNAAPRQIGAARPTPQTVNHEAANVMPQHEPATLPALPHFQQAQQVQPIPQRSPTDPHFDAAARSHTYVPENSNDPQRYSSQNRAPQPAQEQPRYQPVQPYQQPYPQQQTEQRPTQQQHSESKAEHAAPARPRYDSNGH